MIYRIPENEIEFEFTRASGPGGQHVNRVQTAVKLRFDIRHSTILPESVKQRLSKLAGNKVTNEGILVIEARNHRTQARNKAEALERLQELINRAAIRPKKRRATKPSKAARERRLKSKKARSDIKRQRRMLD